MATFSDVGEILARCPDCDGAQSAFTRQNQGPVEKQERIQLNLGRAYTKVHYRLCRCVICGSGALAKIRFGDGSDPPPSSIEAFYPQVVNQADIPTGVPAEIQKELRESELCASVGANKAASAMLRSALEQPFYGSPNCALVTSFGTVPALPWNIAFILDSFEFVQEYMTVV